MIPLVLAAALQAPDFQSYRAHIEAASASLAAGNSRRAAEWLQQAPKKHRGWEWDYLIVQTDSSLMSVQTGSPITKVQTSPDGTLVATAHADGAIRLFQTRDLTSVATLKGHKNSVFGIAFSDDGKRLVSTSRDNSIRLWDVGTRSEIGVLGEHPVTPYNAAFTPDGKRVVSVGWRMHPEQRSPVGLIRVWDVESRTMLSDQDYTTHPISSLDFSPDGSRAFIGCWEYQTAIMDMTDYKIVGALTPKETSTYKAVDWVEVSPDGKSLLTACKDKTVRRWDLATNAVTAEFSHKGSVATARFENKWVITGGQDGAVRVWNGAGGEVATYYGHGAPITGVATSNWLAISGDAQGRLMQWSLLQPETYAPRFEIPGAWSCVYSPGGKTIASAASDKTIKLWDAKTLALKGEIPGFGSLVVDVAWSPTGDRIVGGSNDGTVRAFDVARKLELWQFKGKGQMRAVDWSADGKFVASGDGSTGIGYVFDAVNGKPLVEVKMAPGTLCVAFAPDSKRVAFASGKSLQAIELQTYHPVAKTELLASAAYDIAYAPDGQTIAVGEQAGQVELIRVRDGRVLWTTKTDGSQWGIHFSPDGKRIASFGYDFALHLFEPKSGLEVFALRDLPHEGFDVRFSPRSDQLAFLSGTGICWTLDRRPYRTRL